MLATYLRIGCLALLPLAAAAQTPTPLVEVTTTAAIPETRLQLQTTGGFYLGGTFDGDPSLTNIPIEGGGAHVIWYPGRAAFRAGHVDDSQWDAANTGNASVGMGLNARASGDYSVSLGRNVVAAGTGCVALGEFNYAVGNNSVALGYHANTRTSAFSGRQGTFVFADRSVPDNGNSFDYSDEFFCETNHSAAWRVTGGFRVVTGGSIAGGQYFASRGVSILPGTTSGLTTDWGQSTALIATSSGAYLSGGGTWMNASDRRKKHLLEAVSGEDVLRRLRQLPITRWSYKTEPATVRHLGPMAQDFRRAFGLGQDSVSIGTVDADGVALAAAQALDARTRALQAENAQLRARLTALERLTNTPNTAGFSLNALLLALGASLLTALLPRRRAVG